MLTDLCPFGSQLDPIEECDETELEGVVGAERGREFA